MLSFSFYEGSKGGGSSRRVGLGWGGDLEGDLGAPRRALLLNWPLESRTY